MSFVFGFLFLVTRLYVLILLARVISDLVSVMARDWEPKGFVLVVMNWVYRLTDPPLRLLARVIPPLRVGPVAFDLGFLVLLIGTQLLGSFFYRFQ